MTLPGKHPDLIVREADPANAGPPLRLLRQSWTTPTALFFTRNHGPIPRVDAAAFRLQVSGLVQQPLSLSLDDLRRRFPRRAVTATLQCAGNRRRELTALAPVPGELIWDADAVGNAEWSGVALRDVLAAAGPQPEARHAVFTGLDQIARIDGPFGGSIPLEKALAAEVLLADTMNGEPLPALHGFPLRAVVPGYIGARSVKWLAGIHLGPAPSDNYYQAHAYKLFPPEATPETVDWSGGLMLGEVPVNAAICEPEDGQALPAGAVTVRGYALSARPIARVDVSADDGEHWTVARLSGEGAWGWRFWEAEVTLRPGPQTLIARAWDTAANTQPEHTRTVWNFKGYLNNAWHRVRVRGAA